MAEHAPVRPEKNDAHSTLEVLNRRNSTVEWRSRRSLARKLLHLLERISLLIETPVVWLTRESKYNPLYHTGTIATFFLIAVFLTGIYLTLFYQFGFGVSYKAVATIEANIVGQIMRAVHRYASGASVVFTLLHAWRMLFMDRLRGPRWVAWVSGVAMTVILWIAGVTGYWLIWDERAQLLTDSLFELVQGSNALVRWMLDFVYGPQAEDGWVFVLVILTLHVGISVAMVGGYWLHIVRLRRAKILPPRFWMITLSVLMVLVALALPVGMLPPLGDGARPVDVPIDPLFLFFLPALRDLPVSPWAFWGAAMALTTAVGLLPWVLRGRKTGPVVVDAETCTGCTLCERDCPYSAITMVERPEDHRHKYLAVIDPELCVSCGVCLGSCPPNALSLSSAPGATVFAESAPAAEAGKTVVFTCERHLNQGAGKYLDNPEYHVVPLTCAGAIQPGLLTDALDKGANDVMVVGCPPEDCSNREGNLWIEQRLARERLPKLRRKYVDAPIRTHWLAPNLFGRAFAGAGMQETATAYKLPDFKWLNFLPAAALLAVIFGAQVAFSGVSFQPNTSPAGMIELLIVHHSTYPLEEYRTPTEPEFGAAYPVSVSVTLDGETVFDRTYTPRSNGGRLPLVEALERITVPVGASQVRVVLIDDPTGTVERIVLDELVDFSDDTLLRINLVDEATFGDPVAGRRLYNEQDLGTNVGCSLCHSLEKDVNKVGPSFYGLATRAETTVPGLTAEQYIRQSILVPNAHLVEGYPPDQMVQDYETRLTPQQIDDLVAFLLTLEEEQ